MSDVESFRKELQSFLETELAKKVGGELPPITSEYWGGKRAEMSHPNAKKYCEAMAERGLTAPSWPKQYGGGGLSGAEIKVLAEELKRLRLPPPLVGFGLSMI